MSSLKPFQMPVAAGFGAPMGRQQSRVEEFVEPVYLQKVPMFDGDYDEGGVYWGEGKAPLYCAWDNEGHAIYIRGAKNALEAKIKLPAWKYAGKEPGSKNSLYAEEMLQQYMETALWSSTDDEDVPLDSKYSTDDISKKTKKEMLADCQAFYDRNQTLLEDLSYPWPADQAGHEFWLTRNGHGSGFWDSEYGTSESRAALTKACKKFGESNLYVARGKIHQA